MSDLIGTFLDSHDSAGIDLSVYARDFQQHTLEMTRSQQICIGKMAR